MDRKPYKYSSISKFLVQYRYEFYCIKNFDTVYDMSKYFWYGKIYHPSNASSFPSVLHDPTNPTQPHINPKPLVLELKRWNSIPTFDLESLTQPAAIEPPIHQNQKTVASNRHQKVNSNILVLKISTRCISFLDCCTICIFILKRRYYIVLKLVLYIVCTELMRLNL